MTLSQPRTVPVPPLDELLARVTVHFLGRGRIRFHLDFRGDPFLCDAMRRELQRHGGAHLVSYSSRTRTALITSAPAQARRGQIAESLLRGVKEFIGSMGDATSATIATTSLLRRSSRTITAMTMMTITDTNTT